MTFSYKQTVLAFLQFSTFYIFSSPVYSSIDHQNSVILHQSFDPLSHKTFRMDYIPSSKRIFLYLLDGDLILDKVSYYPPDDVLSINTSAVFNNDKIVIAGQLKDNSWFIRSMNSQGTDLWYQQSIGPINDLSFRQNGEQLFVVSDSSSGEPLLLIINSVSGEVVYRPDSPADTFNKLGSFKQVVTAGPDEFVIAHIGSTEGTLKLYKWRVCSEDQNNLQWCQVTDFSVDHKHTGVISVALKKGSSSHEFFSIVSTAHGLNIELINAKTGKIKISTFIPSIHNIRWSQALRFDAHNFMDKNGHINFPNIPNIYASWLVILVHSCDLGILAEPLSAPLWVDLCTNFSLSTDTRKDATIFTNKGLFEWSLNNIGIINISLTILAITGAAYLAKKYFSKSHERLDMHTSKPSNNDLPNAGMHRYIAETVYKADKMDMLALAIELQKTFPIDSTMTDQARFSSSSNTHHFVSNEYPRSPSDTGHLNYKKVIDFIDHLPQEQFSGIKVGFLIGESSLAHCLPELSKLCNMIIIVDCDPDVLLHQLNRIKLMQLCNYKRVESAFENELLSACSQQSLKTSQKLNYEYQKECLGRHYLFSSPSRYRESQKVLGRLLIIAVQLNIFSGEHIPLLTSLLKKHKAEISFFNLSNTLDLKHSSVFYDMNPFDFCGGPPSPCKHLKQLPLSKNCVCVLALITDVPFSLQATYVFSPVNRQVIPSCEESGYFFNVAERLIVAVSCCSLMELIYEVIEMLHDPDNLKLLQRLLSIASKEELIQLKSKEKEILKILRDKSCPYYDQVSYLVRITLQQSQERDAMTLKKE